MKQRDGGRVEPNSRFREFSRIFVQEKSFRVGVQSNRFPKFLAPRCLALPGCSTALTSAHRDEKAVAAGAPCSSLYLRARQCLLPRSSAPPDVSASLIGHTNQDNLAYSVPLRVSSSGPPSFEPDGTDTGQRTIWRDRRNRTAVCHEEAQDTERYPGRPEVERGQEEMIR